MSKRQSLRLKKWDLTTSQTRHIYQRDGDRPRPWLAPVIDDQSQSPSDVSLIEATTEAISTVNDTRIAIGK